MKILLERTDSKFQFKSGTDNQKIFSCASEALQGEKGKGQRPMALLLNALASCMSIDVLNILYKQKQEIREFKVAVEAIRGEMPPSAFQKIDLEFILGGNINKALLQKAILLAQEKYCSVYHSLSSNIEFTFKSRIDG